MQKIRVIHADDHSILRYGLRKYLSKKDDIKLVGEASSGEQCISLYKKQLPDVCLIDIEMPDKNGIEVVRTIRTMDPEVKLLILSMHSDHETLREAKNAGIDGYLPKNTPKSEIVEAIRKLMRGKKVFQKALNHSKSVPNYASRANDGDVPNITSREREILQLIVAGNSSPQIAHKLFISRRTVDTHRNNMMQKLDLHNTASLVRFALQNNLVNPSVSK